eukprot:TRINITY_DN4635_c0_g1_i1.p1 TRINITY_DN4635_c0_g1~~TRINITY_DN4635_c0_g1_i1.p1  ORF type:complete len:186 (-),score=50.84 TRINITY_DN4635_c0_g1_i1:123-680(-)
MESAAGELQHPSTERKPFSTLREHDDGGHLLQHVLRHCTPPCMAHPAVWWRCGATARFLQEAVREMERPDGTDPDLEELRGWKGLPSLWEAHEHEQAAEVLISSLMRCSPVANQGKIRQGLGFNEDGTLQDWNLSYCELSALPEEICTVRTTRDLFLQGNKLTCLPDSFGAVTVGGNLYLSLIHI